MLKSLVAASLQDRAIGGGEKSSQCVRRLNCFRVRTGAVFVPSPSNVRVLDSDPEWPMNATVLLKRYLNAPPAHSFLNDSWIVWPGGLRCKHHTRGLTAKALLGIKDAGAFRTTAHPVPSTRHRCVCAVDVSSGAAWDRKRADFVTSCAAERSIAECPNSGMVTRSKARDIPDGH